MLPFQTRLRTSTAGTKRRVSASHTQSSEGKPLTSEEQAASNERKNRTASRNLVPCNLNPTSRRCSRSGGGSLGVRVVRNPDRQSVRRCESRDEVGLVASLDEALRVGELPEALDTVVPASERH